MGQEMCRKIFTAYIRPKLQNSSQVWFLHLKKHIDLIDIQQRAKQVVPKIKYPELQGKDSSYESAHTEREKKKGGT